MTKFRISLLLTFLSFSFLSSSQASFDINDDHEKKIDRLLKKMSIAEKVGQTCQITLDVVLKTDESGKSIEPAQIDRVKLIEAIDSFHLGSILNVSSHTLTIEVWKNILNDIENVCKELKIDVPIIYGIDAIHGVNYTVGATLFPQEIGLAATWNRDLARKFAEITAYEMRYTGLKWNFSPVLDLARQPLWSRYFETLGEDPFLASELGLELINGYQGKSPLDANHVASCLKHFVGYSGSFSGRDRTPAWIPKKYMKELYLPAFQKAIEGGAMTVMVNSGDVNGIPGHANKYLLTDVLKGEWSFKGFAVSDWEDYLMLETVHEVARNPQEAIVLAFNSGVDMSMVPLSPQYKVYCEAMIKAVCEKQISAERLNDGVRRILRVKMAMGLFGESRPADYSKFGSQEFKKAAFTLAAESITLLKNEDNFLPLNKSQKVLVAGPTSNDLNFLNGAWTHTWQGVDSSFNTKGCLSIRQAFEKKVGKENVSFSQGAKLFFQDGWETSSLENIDDFMIKAKAADVIVLCLGELPSTEKPGDIRSLNLNPEQIELAKYAYETGKPVLLVLVEGRPRIMHPIVDQAAGIIQTYLPGDYGGEALVDIIYGDVNPSGKLPYTYPKYDGVIEFYDHPRSVGRSGKSNEFDAFDPEWEFGYGLSFSSFNYSNITIDKTSISKSESLTVSIEVENTSERSGKEVVQLYIHDKVATYVPAGKRLKGFQKIHLEKGEKKKITFTLSAEDFKFADSDGNWILEPGLFELTIDKQKTTFELK
jgi:beta-glucosidase